MQMSLELVSPSSSVSARPVLSLDRVAWSYSRRGVLEQCPRRYYYKYFGAGRHVAISDDTKERLRFLKGLSNRYERVGILLHRAVAKYLRECRSDDAGGLSGLGNWVASVFEKDIAYSSQDRRGLNPPSGKFPPVLLTEYYYDLPDADSECREALKRMVAAFDNFCGSPSFSRFREPVGLLRSADREEVFGFWISLQGFRAD